MTTSHHIRCGDCPHLIRERWPGGRIATRCGSPESPWAPIKRVLAVMPDITSDPGTSTTRQRWCHDKAEKEQRGQTPQPPKAAAPLAGEPNRKEIDMEEIAKEREQLLDDCVAMVEAIRCMEDRGVETIDGMGVTLTEEAFDRCFPGMEWAPVTVDGQVIAYIKEAGYRGFQFDCVKDAERA